MSMIQLKDQMELFIHIDLSGILINIVHDLLKFSIKKLWFEKWFIISSFGVIKHELIYNQLKG